MKSINKLTMRHDVRLQIQESILNNELKPGDRIVETKIAEQMGVSQSPVREAIRELELMGLIESKPFLGCFVKVLTKKDIGDIYMMRAELEMFATREATKKITNEKLKILGEVLEKMRIAVDNNAIRDFTELDIEFHKIIIEAADNIMLRRFWALGIAQWTYVTTNRITLDDFHDLIDKHQAIYNSMMKHNSAEAAMKAKNNVEELYKKILSKIRIS
ncbi:MAG: GntR family transcriptional regulator [Candidatus Humimicrobiaceae bacterium]